MIPYKEAEVIWKNTPTFEAASGEITTHPDLYRGLEESGYREVDPGQRYSHLHFCTEVVVFDRLQLPYFIDAMESMGRFGYNEDGERWFCMRLDQGSKYRDGFSSKTPFAVPPSKRLNAEDLKENPFLLSLLIGESQKHSYIDGYIHTDKENGEVFLQTWHLDKRHTLSQKEKFDRGEALKRAKKGTREILCEMPDPLGFSFEYPHLRVDGVPLYELDAIPYERIRIRELRKRLGKMEDKNPKARKGIQKGIENHRENIESGNGIYFPCFRVLEQE